MKGNVVKKEHGGVLLIDKPAGMTSHDVVNKIRRLYNTKRVGHTGTLDPMATGLLVVLVGRASKAAEFLTADTKRYEAKMILGITTDTLDTTGKVLTKTDDLPERKRVFEVCREFLGDIMQVPPMYSALKVGGKKLCDIAREGGEIERQARPVHIDYIRATQLGLTPEYTLVTRVSKGTYIRTLCADIGEKLGCGAAMSALRRTESGAFKLKDAFTPEQIEEMDEDARYGVLIQTEELFSDCPAAILPEFFERLCRNGAEIYQKKIDTYFEPGMLVRLRGKNGFFALGEVREYPDGTAIKAIKNFDVE